MRTSAVCNAICLVVLSAGLASADGAAVVASGTIEELIADLGADRYVTREIATARLAEIGSPARPFLEEAATSRDAEVRKRAHQALSKVEQAEFQARLRAFAADIDGRENVTLPAWKKFRTRFGDDLPARDIFVAMQRSQPELMQAYETGKQDSLQMLEQVCFAAAARTALRSSGVVEPVKIGTVAAVLLVSSDPEIKSTSQTLRSIFSLVYRQPFLTSLVSQQGKTKTRELLGAWIVSNTDTSSPLGYQNLQLALRHNIEEGLKPALKIIKAPKAASTHLHYAALTIGKFGSIQHIVALEPLLANEAVCARARIRVTKDKKTMSQQIKVQVRDVVLAQMITLAGERLADYGYPAPRLHSQTGFVASSLYFPNDKARDAALKKWRERSEAGKKTAVEEIE